MENVDVNISLSVLKSGNIPGSGYISVSAPWPVHSHWKFILCATGGHMFAVLKIVLGCRVQIQVWIGLELPQKIEGSDPDLSTSSLGLYR